MSGDGLEHAPAAARPGVTGVELSGIACDVFEVGGHPTQRTRAPGEALTEGFLFSLGDGVGLELDEAPPLGRCGADALVPGDVLAVERGTSRGPDGARVEDLLLVTEDGCEVLADDPYDPAP